jgi:hypothetical protein
MIAQGDTMERHDRLNALDPRPAHGPSLLRLGLWLRAAIVGAAFAVAGGAALVGTPTGLPVLTAVTWIAAGGTFAWLAWQRATTLLDRIDADDSNQADVGRGFRMRPGTRAPAAS